MKSRVTIFLLSFHFVICSCFAGFASEGSSENAYTILAPDKTRVLLVTSVPVSIGDQFFDGQNWFEVIKVDKANHIGYTKTIPASQSISAKQSRTEAAGLITTWLKYGLIFAFFFFIVILLVFRYIYKKVRY
jgi:hypothetical protein